MKNINKPLVISALVLGAVLGSVGVTQAAFPSEDNRGIGRAEHAPFFENLTPEQKAVAEQARELHQAGNHEEARALMEASDIELPAPHFGQKGERGELF